MKHSSKDTKDEYFSMLIESSGHFYGFIMKMLAPSESSDWFVYAPPETAASGIRTSIRTTI